MSVTSRAAVAHLFDGLDSGAESREEYNFNAGACTMYRSEKWNVFFCFFCDLGPFQKLDV